MKYKPRGWSLFLIYSTTVIASFNACAGQYYSEPSELSVNHKLVPLISLTLGGEFAKVGGGANFMVGESLYTYRSITQNSNQPFFGVSVGTELRLYPQWAMQVGLGYYQADVFSTRGMVTQGIDAPTADQFLYNYKVKNQQLVAEGKLLANLYQRFHPFIYGALGAGFNSAYQYNVNITPPFITMSPQFSNHSKTSFSYILGIGGEVDLNQHARLGVGYRYSNLGSLSLGSGIINTTSVSNSIEKSNIDTQAVFAQFTYLFF